MEHKLMQSHVNMRSALPQAAAGRFLCRKDMKKTSWLILRRPWPDSRAQGGR